MYKPSTHIKQLVSSPLTDFDFLPEDKLLIDKLKMQNSNLSQQYGKSEIEIEYLKTTIFQENVNSVRLKNENSDTIEKLYNQIKQLENQLIIENFENKKLSSENSALIEKYNFLYEDNCSKTIMIDQITEKSIFLERNVDKHVQEIGGLRETSKIQGDKDKETIKSLNNTIIEMESRIKSLEKDNEMMKKSADLLAIVEIRLENILSEKEELQGKYAKTLLNYEQEVYDITNNATIQEGNDKQTIESLNNTVIEMESRSKSLEKDNAMMKKSAEILNNTIIEMERRSKSLEKDNAMMKKSADMLANVEIHLESILLEKEEVQGKYTKMLLNHEQEIQEIKKNATMQENTDKEKIERLNDTITEMNCRSQSLENDNHSMTKRVENVSQLELQMKNTLLDKKELQLYISKLESDKATSDPNIELLNQALNDTMDLNNSLVDQRRDLNDQLHNTAISLAEKEDILKDYYELGKKLDVFKTSNEDKSNQIAELQVALDSSTEESEKQIIILDTLKQDLADTVELNNRLIIQRQDLSDHLHQASLSLAEKEDILKDYYEIRSKLEYLQASIANKSREYAELHMLLESSRAEIKNQIITIKSQNQTIADTQAELDDVVDVNASLQYQRVDSTNLLHRQSVDSTEISNKHITEIENLNECRNKHFEEMNCLKIEIKNLTNTVTEYSSHIEKQENKISKLEENTVQYAIDLELSHKVKQGIKYIYDTRII
jgi:chromosome segregation ATPase